MKRPAPSSSSSSSAKLFVITCDGDFDQICETSSQAEKEKRDLMRMGFQVRLLPAATWEEAQAIADKLDAR